MEFSSEQRAARNSRELETRAAYRAIIRAHYGHNGAECRVIIKNNGEIYRYGSPDITDRSHDYWAHIADISDMSASHNQKDLTNAKF